MRMKSWTSCLLATTLVLVTVGPTAFAQQARGDWTAVQALAADADISIHLKTGKKVRGEFLSATDNELTITRKGKGESFAKDSIAQIERLERKAEKGKYAAIGAAIGTGVGAGIGGAKASSTSDDGYVYTIVGVAFGAGFGALGGFLFGQAKRKHVLIYQAP
ncbi:MAG: hypothetical protein ACXW18_05920 [Pyrinomonadaceae bacterium]